MYLSILPAFDQDYGGTVSMLDLMRRRMNDLFTEFDQPSAPTRNGSANRRWPSTNVYDSGSEVVISAVVPGMSEKDIAISTSGNVVTVSGQRTMQAPEGYAVHRQERSSVNFSRSFTLPCKIDPEKTTATVKDGMLLIYLPKSADAQPKQITVKAI